MLTHRAPVAPDRGDRIRSYHLLCQLSAHFRVSLACLSDEPIDARAQRRLSAQVERLAIEPLSPLTARLRGGAALLRGQPVTPNLFYRPALARTVHRWHAEAPFDAVLTFCTGMVRYARPLLAAQPNLRHVLDLVDVDSIKWAGYAEAAWPPMRWVYATEARRLRPIEAGGRDRFDAITVISPDEAAAYRLHVGKHPGLRVVANGVDLDYFSPLPDAGSHTLAFVGVLDYKPNVEGIAWFVQHVMPLLRRRVLDAKLLIVGRSPTARVRRLGREPGVEVVGQVADVRAYLQRAAAVVAPLRIARGVQNKVLEAMAAGRCVVCSPAAAEGIDASPGEHLLLADTPEAYAQQLSRVLTHASLRQRIAAAARRRVEERYAWDQALQPMLELLGG